VIAVHKTLTIVALAAIVAAVGVGAAIATPGSGILDAPVLARGTLDGHLKIKQRKSGDVAVQQVIVAPGGSTGWHTHLGPAVVIVKSGSFTLYDGDDRRCRGTTYPAGKVFVDEGFGHVHIGRNEGSTNTELYVTYFGVPAGQPVRVDAPDPGRCRF
jgi:quercetin dioxygenase-like cupin family protein